MKNSTKFLSSIIVISTLAGCCQHPETCYPASPGKQYSMMGFIMGGGLVGHAIRTVKKDKASQDTVRNAKKTKGKGGNHEN